MFTLIMSGYANGIWTCDTYAEIEILLSALSMVYRTDATDVIVKEGDLTVFPLFAWRIMQSIEVNVVNVD